MINKKSNALYTYWNSIRGQRPAPDRSEIEPNDIRELLGDTFILEIDPFFNSVSFRLSGTRLCNAYGRELKGLGFMTLWDEQDNFSIHKIVRNVYEQNKPHILHAVSVSHYGETADYQFLMLPLQNNGAATSRILGLATCSSQPEWLGVQPVEINILKKAKEIAADEELVVIDEDAPLAPGLSAASRGVSFERPDRKIGHLTVIDGGRAD